MAFRGFISLDVGPRIDWHALRKELADVDRGVRPVRAEQLHLTLRFLGDTDEGMVDDIERVMMGAVEGFPPFWITFQDVGAFPNARRPRVVWIGLQGAEALSDIAGRLEDGVVGLGFQAERRTFRPHATVARVKFLRRHERMKALLERWRDHRFGSMEVRSIELKRSQLTPQGPVYTTLRSTPLEGR